MRHIENACLGSTEIDWAPTQKVLSSYGDGAGSADAGGGAGGWSGGWGRCRRPVGCRRLWCRAGRFINYQ